MGLPLRVRALGWAVRTVVGPHATMSPARLRLLQAHEGPRRVGELLNGRPDRTVRTESRTAPGPGGDIPTRVHRPPEVESAGNLPVLVVIPGGGFVFGHPDAVQWLATRLCARLPAVVVVPQYRLAPEHRAPAAREDCYAVTAWAASGGPGAGSDGTRLAVLGESAGATLAAGVTLMARELGGPQVRAQVLLQGVFDHDVLRGRSGGAVASPGPAGSPPRQREQRAAGRPGRRREPRRRAPR